ncbi:MAG: 2Fe-2S iron-sulfur cluster-binding protein [Terriglobales bacterium]
MPKSVATYRVQLLLPDGERTVTVSGKEHIWDAAFAQGIVLPALCHQGWCLTCAGRLEAEGDVDQSDSVSYYPEDREAGFVLLCTGKPQSSVRIRTHQAAAMRKNRKQKRLPAPYS